jgi:uncharacterized protein (DUF1501 family)
MSHELDPAELRLEAAAAAGCEESRLTLSRRAAMGLTAGFFSWAFAPRFAEAGTTNDPRFLVIVLRGGMDGINTVVPYADPRYEALRTGLVLPPVFDRAYNLVDNDNALLGSDSLLKIDGTFGFNPALYLFNAMYQNGEAAVVHATAPPLRSRSHFDCQDNVENGFPGEKAVVARTGWLNRVITALPTGHPVKVRGAIQVGGAPLILVGPAPVLGWSTSAFKRPDATVDGSIMTVYAQADKAMFRQFRRGLDANAKASVATPDVTYARDAREKRFNRDITTLQKNFRGAGRLMRADNGPRVAVMSVGGFDTHVGQNGILAGQLKAFADALDDFRVTMKEAWAQTAVVCVTEFGRTAAVNGTSGTDHGVGTVALLAGGAINGKKVYGDWPGLTNLQDGRDLRATTDLRAVFKGLLADHLGLGRTTLDQVIFPESADVAPMQGLIRSPTPTVTAEAPVGNRTGIAAYRREEASRLA